MRAVFKNRASVQSKDREIGQAIDDCVAAINTQPMFVGDVSITSGAGTPENKVLGSPGDLYLRTDGSTTTTLYVKCSGVRTKTGWVGK